MQALNLFASVLPGRIRLRHPMLRNRELHARIVERLRPLAEVESNPAVGSMLLLFDPADASLESRLRAELAAMFGAVEQPAEAPDPQESEDQMLTEAGRGARRSGKWELNRVAKIGATASMAVSLAALASSRKLHAQAGALSVALMLVHIAVHWRRALR